MSYNWGEVAGETEAKPTLATQPSRLPALTWHARRRCGTSAAAAALAMTAVCMSVLQSSSVMNITFEQCAALQASSPMAALLAHGPTLAHGIFHAGGILKDAMLAQQTISGLLHMFHVPRSDCCWYRGVHL